MDIWRTERRKPKCSMLEGNNARSAARRRRGYSSIQEPCGTRLPGDDNKGGKVAHNHCLDIAPDVGSAIQELPNMAKERRG